MGKEFTNMEQNQPGEKDQDQGAEAPDRNDEYFSIRR